MASGVKGSRESDEDTETDREEQSEGLWLINIANQVHISYGLLLLLQWLCPTYCVTMVTLVNFVLQPIHATCVLVNIFIVPVILDEGTDKSESEYESESSSDSDADSEYVQSSGDEYDSVLARKAVPSQNVHSEHPYPAKLSLKPHSVVAGKTTMSLTTSQLALIQKGAKIVSSPAPAIKEVPSVNAHSKHAYPAKPAPKPHSLLADKPTMSLTKSQLASIQNGGKIVIRTTDGRLVQLLQAPANAIPKAVTACTTMSTNNVHTASILTSTQTSNNTTPTKKLQDIKPMVITRVDGVKPIQPKLLMPFQTQTQLPISTLTMGNKKYVVTKGSLAHTIRPHQKLDGTLQLPRPVVVRTIKREPSSTADTRNPVISNLETAKPIKVENQSCEKDC